VYPEVSGLTSWGENFKFYSSAIKCSCIAILWVSLVRFAAITLCVGSQRMFIVVSVYPVALSNQLLTLLLLMPSPRSRMRGNSPPRLRGKMLRSSGYFTFSFTTTITVRNLLVPRHQIFLLLDEASRCSAFPRRRLTTPARLQPPGPWLCCRFDLNSCRLR
jgi:hypothetical protein